MAFLSLFSRRPALNQDEERRKYAQAKYQGTGFKGIRLMTPEEERSKRGALPVPVAPSNRILSPEGQARANAMATNAPAVIAASAKNGMASFYQPKTAPYGVSEQGKTMDAKEYAASKDLGGGRGIQSFRLAEATRLADKQDIRKNETLRAVGQSEADAAMGIAAARYADQPKVLAPGAVMMGPNGQIIGSAPAKGAQDPAIIARIAELEAQKKEIEQSGEMKGKRGMLDWARPWAQTRQQEVDKIDAEITALGGTPVPIAQPATPAAPKVTLQPKQLSAEEQAALDWANANPSDPRAAEIKAKLGIR